MYVAKAIKSDQRVQIRSIFLRICISTDILQQVFEIQRALLVKQQVSLVQLATRNGQRATGVLENHIILV